MRASMSRRPEFPINRLREEMDRLVTDFFGNAAAAPSFFQRLATGTYPPLNVWEQGDNLFAEAELPGLKQEDLEVTVVGNELTLSGKRVATEEANTSYHRRERVMGEFSRSLRLPFDIDASQVEATLANGVLTVKLPKAQSARPIKVEVRNGDAPTA